MPTSIITEEDLKAACERSDRGEPESGPATKPPLGIIPRHLRMEQRLDEIVCGIKRYHEAGWAIPAEWFEEAAEITRRLKR
jgi:hypothetical protein